ncbi:MAG: glycosyltransferase [Thermoleophilia bacterium]
MCVPVRNGGRTLRRTLDSILGQDYPNLEVMVSDNCSTDDTPQIVGESAGSGVRYFLNPKLETWGESNWNFALSLARAPLIALYHADDLYSPTMVRRQVEFLETHPGVSAVFTMTRRIDDQDRPVRMGGTRLPQALSGQNVFDSPALLNAVLKYGNFMVVPTMLARKAALDAVGGFRYERFASASDIDLYLRMADWGPIGIIDEPLHRYRVSSEQGSFLWSRQRTSLADFFLVLDARLAVPGVRAMAEPQSLALYELQRAADQVLCAMNLLAQDRLDEARELLEEAVQVGQFVTALKRPRLLARLVIGLGFRASVYCGLGRSVGRVVLRAYELDLRRRLSPEGQ